MSEKTDKIHFTLPIGEIEATALSQIYDTASMDIVRKMAVMPDVHAGKGSTVGTVVLTEGALMPACVGVDIGCGMTAMRLNIGVDWLTPEVCTRLREGIEQMIPVGIGKAGLNESYSPSVRHYVDQLEHFNNVKGPAYYDAFHADWRKSIGTLGGGNHFIEVCVGSDDHVWLTVHSGSRGVGNKIGTYHTQVAQEQCGMRRVKLPHRDLAYLEVGTDEFEDYYSDLAWAQQFAQYNRDEMMSRMLHVVEEVHVSPVHVSSIVMCHHNYVEDVGPDMYGPSGAYLTRKGAVAAYEGMRSLIPGSMGARSYIVVGRGNADALWSAPHGAGRTMSRGQAKRTFDLASLEEATRGIETRLRENIVDEHPGAYKDIDKVMEHSASLVTPICTLRQLVNVKGD